MVGGGITGLAAAWNLTNAPGAARVVLLEGSGQVGGKLALGDVDGVGVDLGAESLLARRPEAVRLAQQVGLGDDLVHPRAVGAGLWSRGMLRPLPAGTLMGVPSSAAGLGGLLTDAEVAPVSAEPDGRWPALRDDVDVSSFLRERVGAGVVDRLVEPLLGGVYAGRADELSLQATVPALWAAAVEGGSVVVAAAAAARAGLATHAPAFVGIRGGVGRLPLAVADRLRERGVELLTDALVRSLRRTPDGWRLVFGPTTSEQAIDVQAVVLASPAAPTSRLLRDELPYAATLLAGVEYAGMAIVTLVLPRASAGALPGSGLLVPPVEGRFVKAATHSSAKWAWLDESDPEQVVARTSVGRYGEQGDLQLDDHDLAARAVADLADLLAAPLPVRAVRVTRWGGGLPQYQVGHVRRVNAARAALQGAPGLVLAGAAYDGVGVPACIASATKAAQEIQTHLEVLGHGGAG